MPTKTDQIHAVKGNKVTKKKLGTGKSVRNCGIYTFGSEHEGKDSK